MARVVTLGLWTAFCAAQLVRLSGKLSEAEGDELNDRAEENKKAFLECLFLIIAAFFVLQPTQNPWYWTWAMPLIPFARNRGWLAVGSFLFLYYSRFWFKFAGIEYRFFGLDYSGAGTFDHCFVWVEHLGIWLAILVGAYCYHRGERRQRCAAA